jgi:predicted nuclease of predicted toxin-antitoxin system
MKLLFDENLSPKMVAALADIFPDSAHVDRIGLGGGSDDNVWRYAKDNGFTDKTPATRIKHDNRAIKRRIKPSC